MPHGKQWTWFLGIFGVLIVAIAILVSFSGGNDDHAASSLRSAPAPTHAPVSAAGCTNKDVVKVLDVIIEPAQKYEDAFRLILSATSAGLTDIASDMQEARREVINASMPTCGEHVRSLLRNLMDTGIDGVIFLQAGGNAAAAGRFEEYTRLSAEFGVAVTNLNP